MKKILAYIAISIVIVVVIFVFLFKSKKSEIVKNPPAPEAIDICYQLSQIDCEALNDKIIVEKYIRDNIKTIAPENAVLGGSWYWRSGSRRAICRIAAEPCPPNST